MRLPSIRSSTIGNAIALVLLVLALLIALADEGSGAPIAETNPAFSQSQYGIGLVSTTANAAVIDGRQAVDLVPGYPVRLVPGQADSVPDRGSLATLSATSP